MKRLKLPMKQAFILVCPPTALDAVFFFNSEAAVWTKTSLVRLTSTPFGTFDTILIFVTKTAIIAEARLIIRGTDPFATVKANLNLTAETAVTAKTCWIVMRGVGLGG